MRTIDNAPLAGACAAAGYVLFYAVLANVPYWVTSSRLSILTDGWFAIGYVAVGLLTLAVPRWVGGAALLVAISADLIYGISRSYGISVFDLAANLGALEAFSAPRVRATALVAALVLAAVAAAVSLPARQIRRRWGAQVAACLAVFALLCLAKDFLVVSLRNGRMANPVLFRPRDSIDPGYSREVRLSRVHIFELARSVLMPRFHRAYGSNAAPASRAAAAVFDYAKRSAAGGQADSPNVVLILVESWGVSVDPAIEAGLTEAYTRPEILARYEVRRGTVPFHGSTIDAEARELCGSGMGFHILVASAGELQDCLPAALSALGYSTTAAHGLEGSIFNRTIWWRRAGFQQEWFADRLREMGLRDCVGAYIGVCDADIADWMGRRLESAGERPAFFYWVTLHSHLPVPVPSAFERRYRCPSGGRHQVEPPLCSWYSQVANVHDSVARLAAGRLGRPTMFVVVGDHAPPFSDPLLRSGFSPSAVPFLVLTPRSGPQPAFAAGRGLLSSGTEGKRAGLTCSSCREIALR